MSIHTPNDPQHPRPVRILSREWNYEADFGTVSLPASFNVWLASPEARFLKGKFLWVNWDVDELKARAKEIEGTQLFSIELGGWPFGGKIEHTGDWKIPE